MTTIYGQEIRLKEIEDDITITDVLVIARGVYLDENGDLQDTLTESWTPHTTGIIQAGMVSAYQKAFEVAPADDDD